MTLSSSTYAPLTYSGNGLTTSFSVTFQFYEIAVTHIDANATETLWTEGTEYTLSGGSGFTGTVTVITAPPAAGESLRIDRMTARNQVISYDVENTALENALQTSLDRSYMIMQEEAYNIDQLQGDPAAQWFTGSGVPSSSLGSIYDMYLDTLTGDVYGPKTVSGWGVSVANIIGPQGIQGIQGNDGSGSGDMTQATYDPTSINEQLVGLTATQTLTNKTITQPILTLNQGAAPTPTGEGNIQWDTNDDRIVVGDGAATKIFSDDDIVQARTNHTGTQLLSTISDAGSLAALNEVDHAQMTAKTQGSVIYYGSGGAASELVAGTAGQILQTNGSGQNPSWADVQAGGKVLQVVQGSSNSQTTISSTSLTDTGLSAVITPSSASSQVLIFASHPLVGMDTGTDTFDENPPDEWGVGYALLRGGSSIIATQTVSATEDSSNFLRITSTSFCYLDGPNTTSATTYKTQARMGRTDQDAVYIYTPSYMILMEIST